ncbi:MAG: VWA domain-containing protein [Nanoarchaeota archaeon]|nr:VWA domain-containing protein [Nanoarchaeota archaeon]
MGLKGYLFSMDALISLLLVLMLIVLLPSFYLHKPEIKHLNYLSTDVTNTLSTLKVGEIDNAYVKSLIQNGNITNTNNSILEQIGEFWALGREDEALLLIDNTITPFIPGTYGYGIWINNDLIFSNNKTSEKYLIVARDLVSGIQKGEAVYGLTTKAFLKSINQRTTSSFAFFGGYVGDGKISKYLILPSTISSINEGYFELDIGNDFDLYVNNIYSGHYLKPTSGVGKYNLNNSYLNNFNTGVNIISFNFSTLVSNYIGGGYFKVKYSTSELDAVGSNATETYYLPGIEGIINLYSSLYIPGNITSSQIYLHYINNYSMILNIGNVTIFNQTNATTEQSIIISNSEIESKLNYDDISKKTLPLRIGSEGGNVTITESIESDVILVTDTSGSMSEQDVIGAPGQSRLDVAKQLDSLFVNVVLNSSNNRAGLVDYATSIKGTEDLTNDNQTLQNEINTYTATGSTCICCGINESTDMLNAQSSQDKYKSIVLMSDGEANQRCTTNYDCECLMWFWGYCWWWDCTEAAKLDSIDFACDAYENHNITVHSVGLGQDADEETLQSIADCGNGTFYASNNFTELQQIYENLAIEATNAPIEYIEQKISLSNFTSLLYPDSYIQINYLRELPQLEYAYAFIPIETPRFNNGITEGSFVIPQQVSIIDAKVTSYSGSKWTDNIKIYNSQNPWTEVFDLSDYGEDYEFLGDPYIVNIPPELIAVGENNSVRIATGLSPTNYTGGHIDDRAIYTMGLNLLVNYSGIFPKAEGCNWYLEFEDGTNSNLNIPINYSGTQSCTFTSTTNCNVDYSNDAINNALCNLFSQLDFDNNGKLYVNFDEGDLEIETISVQGIPYMWGPALIEVRTWQ